MDCLTSQVAQASARQRPYSLHGCNAASPGPATRTGTARATLMCIIRQYAAAARQESLWQCCQHSQLARKHPGRVCEARLLHVGACDPGVGIQPRVPPARLLAWVGERAGCPVVAEALGARDDLRTRQARHVTARARRFPTPARRSRARGTRPKQGQAPEASGAPVQRAACAAPSCKTRGSQTSGTAGSRRHPGSCLSLAPAAAPARPSSATLDRKAAAAKREVLPRARTLSGCMHGKPIRWACCMVIAGPSCARVARLQLAGQEDVAPQGHQEAAGRLLRHCPTRLRKFYQNTRYKLTSSCIRTALYDCLLMHPSELSEQAASSAPKALSQGPVRADAGKMH